VVEGLAEGEVVPFTTSINVIESLKFDVGVLYANGEITVKEHGRLIDLLTKALNVAIYRRRLRPFYL